MTLNASRVKALTKLVPYVVRHPMLASFLAGSAAKLPTTDIEKALTSIGLGEDLEEIKDTILTGLVGPDPLSPIRSRRRSNSNRCNYINSSSSRRACV